MFRSCSRRYRNLRIEPHGSARTEGNLLGTLAVLIPLLLIAMYVLIAAFLRSYWKPVIAVAGIPIAFSGAVVSHWILGWDFSAMSLFGVIGVAGVIVNDALVLMDRYNVLRRESSIMLPAIAAASAATRHRFRAVFLTSLTTILALAPLLYVRTEELMILVPFVVSMLGGVGILRLLHSLPAAVAGYDCRGQGGIGDARSARGQPSNRIRGLDGPVLRFLPSDEGHQNLQLVGFRRPRGGPHEAVDLSERLVVVGFIPDRSDGHVGSYTREASILSYSAWVPQERSPTSYPDSGCTGRRCAPPLLGVRLLDGMQKHHGEKPGANEMAEWESTSDQDRQKLRNLLLEGMESPPAVTADAAYFETMRAEVDRHSKG